MTFCSCVYTLIIILKILNRKLFDKLSKKQSKRFTCNENKGLAKKNQIIKRLEFSVRQIVTDSNSNQYSIWSIKLINQILSKQETMNIISIYQYFSHPSVPSLCIFVLLRSGFQRGHLIAVVCHWWRVHRGAVEALACRTHALPITCTWLIKLHGWAILQVKQIALQ